MAASCSKSTGSAEDATDAAGSDRQETITLDAGPADASTPDRDLSDAIAAMDSSTSSTSTSACGRVSFSTHPGCGACQVAHCCTTAMNCAANNDCMATHDCEAACSNRACLMQCETMHGAGVWDFSGLLVCLTDNCASECGFPAAQCGDITLTTPDCDTCFKQQCCAQGTACGANDQCLALIYQCLDKNNCPDSSGPCAQDCRHMYSGGASAFDASLQCARIKCPVACAGI
jgi:hypothetical protein